MVIKKKFSLIFFATFVIASADLQQIHITSYSICNKENGFININGEINCADGNPVGRHIKKEMIFDLPKNVCLREKESRGIGTELVKLCPKNRERINERCYEKCADGFEKVPDNPTKCRVKGCGNYPYFVEMGTGKYCKKSASYSRGSGYGWSVGDIFSETSALKRCENEHGEGLCEKYDGKIFPKCEPGYHNKLCCTCSPNCPENFYDEGDFCVKIEISRYWIDLLFGCKQNKVIENGRCFDKCKLGFETVGQICWSKCAGSHSFDCGMFCTENEFQCLNIQTSLAKYGLETIASSRTIGISNASMNGDLISSNLDLIFSKNGMGVTFAHELKFKPSCSNTNTSRRNLIFQSKSKIVCIGETGTLLLNKTIDCKGNKSVSEELKFTTLEIPADICVRYKINLGKGIEANYHCDKGYEKIGEQCYRKCKAGFEPIRLEPEKCRRTDCGGEEFEESAHRGRCIKPSNYHRGKGYPRKVKELFHDEEMIARCEADHGEGNCEKFGSSAYPKCRKNFKAINCCTCEPQCPANFNDTGGFCYKEVYERQFENAYFGCSFKQDLIFNTCYDKCENGFFGVNATCWKACPSTHPYNCGIFCSKDKQNCKIATKSLNHLDGLARLVSLSNKNNHTIMEADNGAILTTAWLNGYTILYELDYDVTCK